MILTYRSISRYGLPLGLLYCSIYQQNVWREGDERLLEEQKQSWRKFFSKIDCFYSTISNKLTRGNKSEPEPSKDSFVSRLEKLDFKTCWNTKMINFFSSIDLIVNNPKYAACKTMRVIQPYISKPSNPHQS